MRNEMQNSVCNFFEINFLKFDTSKLNVSYCEAGVIMDYYYNKNLGIVFSRSTNN